MTIENPKPNQLLRPITTGANSAMNQSQFLAITCNSHKAREKSRVHSPIVFGLVSHWFKNWRDAFKPITKRSNRNHVITFNSHLKTALKVVKKISKVMYAIPLSITGNTWAWGNSGELKEPRLYRSPRTENVGSKFKQKGFFTQDDQIFVTFHSNISLWNWIIEDKKYLKCSCDAVALSAIYIEPQSSRKMTTNTTQKREMSR